MRTKDTYLCGGLVDDAASAIGSSDCRTLLRGDENNTRTGRVILAGRRSSGRSSLIQWSHCGQPAGSIGTVAKANCVHLVYRHRAWGDQWQDMREIASFTETRTCFGGRRRWFACPRCSRPCRVLFGGPFRCRRCHGLHYSSQYQTAGDRAIGRLQALRTRLGGSGDLVEPAKAQAHAA